MLGKTATHYGKEENAHVSAIQPNLIDGERKIALIRFKDRCRGVDVEGELCVCSLCEE
jgi:hypothetical protein